MKISITKKDYIWSYAGYFFTLFTNIIILPFVMKLVPSQELGLWYTFLSVGLVANIFDNTFTLSISRNVTYAWSGIRQITAEGFDGTDISESGHNFRLLVSIVQTCRAIFAVTAFSALALMLTAGTAYIGYTARNIDPLIWVASWLVFSGAVFLNLFYSYWVTALRGVGAIQESQKANVIAKSIQIALSIAGLFLGGGILALSLSYFASGLILRTLSKGFFMRFEGVGTAYRTFRTDISKAETWDNFRKIWHNAKKNGLNALATFGITQSTTLICSAYLGLNETASFGLCSQIVTAVAGVAMVYFNTVKPRMTELKIGGEATREEFVRLLSLSATVYWFAYLLEFAILMAIGLPALDVLQSDTEIPTPMLLFMGCYLFLENNHSMFAGIIEMSNTVPYLKAALLSAACIIVGEFIVGAYTDLGIYGLMSVQCVVQLAYNNWKWPSVIMREYRLTPLSILVSGVMDGVRAINRTMRSR